MQLPPAAKRACVDATLQLSTRTQHIMRSAVRFSNDWPSFKHHIPCLFGSSGDRPRRACGSHCNAKWRSSHRAPKGSSSTPWVTKKNSSAQMGSNQDVSGGHDWSSQVRSGQIRSGQQLKPGQLRSGQVTSSQLGSVAAEKQFALLGCGKGSLGIGILLGLQQRVDTTTDGKRRRGQFGACAFRAPHLNCGADRDFQGQLRSGGGRPVQIRSGHP